MTAAGRAHVKAPTVRMAKISVPMPVADAGGAKTGASRRRAGGYTAAAAAAPSFGSAPHACTGLCCLCAQP
eukprot:364271-Chlamydomonas_euryale.AAC.12